MPGLRFESGVPGREDSQSGIVVCRKQSAYVLSDLLQGFCCNVWNYFLILFPKFTIMGEKRRLVILITDGGIDAFLFSESSGQSIVEKHVGRKWQSDRGSMLRNIEDTVYDNPDLIDDIPVCVLVETGRMAMLPVEIADIDPDGQAVASYLFPESGFEPLLSKCGSGCVLNMIPSGILSFIGRTFPGSSVISAFLPLIEKFRTSVGASDRLYVDIHDGKLGLAAFSGERLKLCSFQEYSELTDAVYYIMSTWNAVGFDATAAELYIYGDKDTRMELTPMLRRYLDFVMPVRLPSVLPHDLPLSVALNLLES